MDFNLEKVPSSESFPFLPGGRVSAIGQIKRNFGPLTYLWPWQCHGDDEDYAEDNEDEDKDEDDDNEDEDKDDRDEDKDEDEEKDENTGAQKGFQGTWSTYPLATCLTP